MYDINTAPDPIVVLRIQQAKADTPSRVLVTIKPMVQLLSLVIDIPKLYDHLEMTKDPDEQHVSSTGRSV
jgi:hypothetical protein